MNKHTMKKYVCLAMILSVVALAILPLFCTRVRAAAFMASSSARGAEHGGSTADAVTRAVNYIKGRQQSDGGFAEPGNKSSEQLTAWVICALASAGEDVSTIKKSGRSPLDFLASRAASTNKLTDLEKDCLAVASAGKNPRSFAGRDLVAAIKNSMGADGNIGGMVNEHCWGIIALAAAGEQIPASSRQWLLGRQSGLDGGFSYSGSAASDPDDTGAALQALSAAGETRQGSPVSRAISYLHFCQSSDGGFTWQTAGSNVGSTAWAAQGISATGEDTGSTAWASSGNTPIDFLQKMQQGDGHIKYTATSDANPVWMTAESIPALLKRGFPLKKSEPAPTNTNNPSNNSDPTVDSTGDSTSDDSEYSDDTEDSFLDTLEGDEDEAIGDEDATRSPLTGRGSTERAASDLQAQAGPGSIKMSKGRTVGLVGILFAMLMSAVALGFVIQMGWRPDQVSWPGQ